MIFVVSAGSQTLGRRDNFALATLEVTYKRCLLVFIADTLSSAHLQEALHSEEVKSLELVDHTEKFRVYLSQPEQIEQKSSVTRSCYKVDLARFASATLFCGLSASFVVSRLFREPRLPRMTGVLVPRTLKTEFMSLAHKSHIGLGKCLCWLRTCMCVCVVAWNEHSNEGFPWSV